MFNNLTSRATFYDVTGYLIPGIIALGIGWATCFIYVGNSFLNGTITTLSKLGGVVTTLVIIAVGYVCGHLLNAISSALIERWWLKRRFVIAKDWQTRLSVKGSVREAIIRSRARAVFGVDIDELKSFDLRIRAEEKMPQSFVTGFCFLSFYGMCRTLALTSFMAIPLVAKFGWDSCSCTCQYAWICKLLVSLVFILLTGSITIAFAYQYLRFVTNYYDYLCSTLLYVADGEDRQFEHVQPKGEMPSRDIP